MNSSLRDWLLAGINQPGLVQRSCMIETRSRSGSGRPALLVKLLSLRMAHLWAEKNESQCSNTKSVPPSAWLSWVSVLAAGQGGLLGKYMGQLRDRSAGTAMCRVPCCLFPGKSARIQTQNKFHRH